MNWKNEWKTLVVMIAIFLFSYFLSVGLERFQKLIMEFFHMLKEYSQPHIIFYLLAVFFIAGTISLYICILAVIKHYDTRANKFKSYFLESFPKTGGYYSVLFLSYAKNIYGKIEDKTILKNIKNKEERNGMVSRLSQRKNRLVSHHRFKKMC